MKPVKITVEFTVTPETFKEWCEGDIQESERMYRHYVEKMVYKHVGCDIDYEDYINTTSQRELNGCEWKLTMKELIEPPDNPCPECGKQLRQKWSGVDCSCGYWFCY